MTKGTAEFVCEKINGIQNALNLHSMQTEQLKIRSNLKAIHELKLWFAINLIGIGITEWHPVSIELVRLAIKEVRFQ